MSNLRIVNEYFYADNVYGGRWHNEFIPQEGDVIMIISVEDGRTQFLWNGHLVQIITDLFCNYTRELG